MARSALIIFALVSLASCLAGAILSRRFTQIVIENTSNHLSVAIWTPVGMFPARNTSFRSLADAVYKDAIAVGEVDKSFYRGPIGQGEKIAQLTVLRYRSPSDPKAVSRWYRERLGSTFKQCTAWPCDNLFEDKHWSELVNTYDMSMITAFQERFGNRVRGVELSQRKSQPAVVISIYDFQLAPEEQDSASDLPVAIRDAN